ncbi:methionyl-tRNA formyltransferase [Candidatus Saccharibacteria bacterium]|nr:methionyl-tRNA formyltransferase [Candidatus Saccharibacteria bacterium]
MKKSARLIFFGTEDFSCQSLAMLLEAGWNVLAVVTKADTRSGRGQRHTLAPVKELAIKHTMPVLQPQHISEIDRELAIFSPTHGVLVSYGAIIPKTIIDLFPGGIINLHPSLLPLYRGPSPIETVILNGEEQTGLSLMKLSLKMDAGPVYSQKNVSLSGQENQITLSTRLASLGGQFLVENLQQITNESLSPMPQKEEKASYTKLLKKEDGMIDWSLPAKTYERQVRAYIKYPRSRVRLGEHEVIITKARIAANAKDGYLIKQCRPGWLELVEVIAPSGRLMSGADFLRGYKI